MKLTLGSRDVTAELGAEISVIARRRAEGESPRFHDAGVTALGLRNAQNERQYSEMLLRLVRMRHGATTADFDIPRAPGPIGVILRPIRRFLWKLLRYQHDRMAFQQNLINEMLIHAFEFESARRDQEVASLYRELAILRAEKQ
jgi:hypothetical protein